jgi:hypothetical protein
MDNLTVRGIVLGILRAYMEPSDRHEKEIDALLPLLQHAPVPAVRDQAAHVSRIWLGLRGRCPIHYRRLMFYRIRHLDQELEKLNQMTRPRRKRGDIHRKAC